jgi:hypothetical protein
VLPRSNFSLLLTISALEWCLAQFKVLKTDLEENPLKELKKTNVRGRGFGYVSSCSVALPSLISIVSPVFFLQQKEG